MTVCIHCAMRAMLEGQPSPYFDETPEAHQARMHPDLEATKRERVEMERRLQTMIQEGER